MRERWTRQAFQQKSISLPREVTPSPCARWVIPLRDGRRSWKIGSRTQEFFEKMGQAIVLDERACTSSPRNVCYSGNSLVLRSEERRVGKGGVSTCEYGGSE